jgi:hypothetical protein
MVRGMRTASGRSGTDYSYFLGVGLGRGGLDCISDERKILVMLDRTG